jgi:hypothetical protein
MIPRISGNILTASEIPRLMQTRDYLRSFEFKWGGGGYLRNP